MPLVPPAVSQEKLGCELISTPANPSSDTSRVSRSIFSWISSFISIRWNSPIESESLKRRKRRKSKRDRFASQEEARKGTDAVCHLDCDRCGPDEVSTTTR